MQKAQKDYERNKRACIDRCANIALDETLKNFKEQGVEGIKWEDRTDSTDRHYDYNQELKEMGYSSSNPILFQTGRLFKSIRSWRLFDGFAVTSTHIGAWLLGKGGFFKAFGKHDAYMPSRPFIVVKQSMLIWFRAEIKRWHDKTFLPK